MPPPVDSGGPKDPSADSGWTGASGYLTLAPAVVSAVAVSDHDCCCGCCCGAGSSAASTAGSTSSAGSAARDYSGFVIVRLAAGITDKNALDLWVLADNQKLNGLKAVLELPIGAGKTDQKSDSGAAERLNPTINTKGQSVQASPASPPQPPTGPGLPASGGAPE